MRRGPSLSPRLRSVSAATGRAPRVWAWAALGALLGLAAGLVSQAPAAWLAQAVARLSQDRVQLVDPQGTLWQGSALPVLAGPAGSRDASVLPARLHWRTRPTWLGLRWQLQQPGHIDAPLQIDWQVGWGRQRFELQGAAGALGHWPAAWLAGLGAPLNTLRPGGELRLSSSSGLRVDSDAQGWRLEGQARVELLQFSSRLSTIEPLGSYQLLLAPQGERRVALQLSTLDGALRLSGQGEIGAQGLRLRGEASAAPGQEAALNNLLNIIGRREGALSRLSIG
ncbi:type II secretion system protein N [Ideonella sp. 4Y11]|uniref:Type II secretion system protein N n=2 Tax=Ideonella aquatica TaxID=2824119 RepID=A0A941BSP5_9BURK|nr:type II secretion system protein N [Ideonella aquatica]